MPNLPAHIEALIEEHEEEVVKQWLGPATIKLRAILEAAQAVAEEYSHPFGGLVLHPELIAALDKLKEAMSDDQ